MHNLLPLSQITRLPFLHHSIPRSTLSTSNLPSTYAKSRHNEADILVSHISLLPLTEDVPPGSFPEKQPHDYVHERLWPKRVPKKLPLEKDTQRLSYEKKTETVPYPISPPPKSLKGVFEGEEVSPRRLLHAIPATLYNAVVSGTPNCQRYRDNKSALGTRDM